MQRIRGLGNMIKIDDVNQAFEQSRHWEGSSVYVPASNSTYTVKVMDILDSLQMFSSELLLGNEKITPFCPVLLIF